MTRQDDGPLRARLRELAYQKKRWGYRLLNGALRLEGWAINHKRTYRLYKEETLDLHPKHRKRLKSQTREPRHVAAAPNDVWTLDFNSDKLCDGRSFRTLNVLDVFTRLSIEVDTSLSSGRVVRGLDALLARHGKPRFLQMDNEPEFRSKSLHVWGKKNGVQLDFIEPDKPTQNGHLLRGRPVVQQTLSGRMLEPGYPPGVVRHHQRSQTTHRGLAHRVQHRATTFQPQLSTARTLGTTTKPLDLIGIPCGVGTTPLCNPT